MDKRTEIISRFYNSFNKLDAAGMNQCYADNIVFFDPVFGLLQGIAARAMWKMLCANARDFSLEFGNIQHLDEEYSTCEWTARYTFSRTGRRVVNTIKANMRFADGLIVEHSDAFRLSKWCSQALGLPGLLFGWTNFLQNKIRKQARQNLEKFIERENE